MNQLMLSLKNIWKFLGSGLKLENPLEKAENMSEQNYLLILLFFFREK